MIMDVRNKIAKIKYVFTDCDGVLTDSGVYYSENGEELKRFSVRDGMGIERLRKILNIETGIITGENSIPVKKRAEKLGIKELHPGVKDKLTEMLKISERLKISFDEIAYIGDDVNDYEIMAAVGLCACPKDAMPQIKSLADYICECKGGKGAFREFAELIIQNKYETKIINKMERKEYE